MDPGFGILDLGWAKLAKLGCSPVAAAWSRSITWMGLLRGSSNGQPCKYTVILLLANEPGGQSYCIKAELGLCFTELFLLAVLLQHRERGEH